MRRVLRSGGVWVGATLLALVIGCGESQRPVVFTAGGSGGSGGGSAGLGIGGELVVVDSPQQFLDSCAGRVPRSPLHRWSILDLDQSLDGWFGPGT
jgi:hypothetical protein